MAVVRLWRIFKSLLAFSRFSWDILLLTGGGRAYEVLHFFTGAPPTTREWPEEEEVDDDVTRDDDVVEEEDVVEDANVDDGTDDDVVALAASIKCGLSTYSLGLAR